MTKKNETSENQAQCAIPSVTARCYKALLEDAEIIELQEKLNRLYLNAIPIGILKHSNPVQFIYSDEVNKADAKIKEMIKYRQKQIIAHYEEFNGYITVAI